MGDGGAADGLKDVRLKTLDFEQAGDTGYEVGEATLALAAVRPS